MKTIHIVEDDGDIGAALAIRLASAGYRVLRSGDTTSAYDTAILERPDLLILDISLPGGDGFEVLERLRRDSDCAELPALFLTASRRPELRDRALSVGAVGFVEKPFNSSELLRVVADALAAPGALSH